MKLSMWMIANRICALEPELYIEEDAPICLRSARMAYATDCVHVYQSGADAVCQGIGGKIVLRDMDCQQAFEIIQSVFDIYDDWISGLLPVAGTEDYQRIVDESRQIFQNPVIFLDGDNRVLALSSQYGEKDIDREWEHLCRYGYSSLDYIQKFRRTYSQNDFYIKNKAQLFSLGPELDNCVTMSVAVYYDNLFCGRINVLETDRKLNLGDIQILEILASHLSPYLGAMRYRQNQDFHQNIFQDLLQKQNIPATVLEERLHWQLGYMKWKPEDLFCLLTLHPERKDFSPDLLILAGNQLRKLFPQTSVFTMEDHIVMVCDQEKNAMEDLFAVLREYLLVNHFAAGISLPFRRLEKLRYYHQQALAAVSYGQRENRKSSVCDFYDYALSYIIEISDQEALICACHPDILALAEEDSKNHGDRLNTLCTYLNMERSLLNTAKALYIHRNTLVYRITKIIDSLHYDIEDVYCRDYMKMTFRILKLFSRL